MMTLLFCGNRYKYEMENVARLFFPLRRFQFAYDCEPPVEGDFLAFSQTAEGEGARLTVDFREGEYRDSASTFVKQSGRFDNDCEEAFARLLYRMLEKKTGVQPRWGILTGIRPVRRMQRAIEDGKSMQEVQREFRENCLVHPDKIALAARICALQQPVLRDISPRDFSLYISIPYCPSRCSYCSFVSHSIDHPKARKLIPDYIEHLVKEINFTAGISRELGLRLRSVYIGGGTPTVLEAEQLKRIFDCVQNAFTPDPALEYTVEAGRADTITREKLAVIREGGANRVSINPQSFQDSVLEAVGRRHTANDVVKCYEMAREFGFAAINMDLIAGLPTDTPDAFADSLHKAIALGPENITVHALSVKRAAALFSQMDGSEDYRDVQRMVDISGAELPAAGYEPYYLYRQKNTIGNLENVGYAKPGTLGLYNIYIMEEVQHILAVGAGGVSKVVRPGHIDRVFNYKYPYEYIAGFSDILSRKETLRGLLEEVQRNGI